MGISRDRGVFRVAPVTGLGDCSGAEARLETETRVSVLALRSVGLALGKGEEREVGAESLWCAVTLRGGADGVDFDGGRVLESFFSNFAPERPTFSPSDAVGSEKMEGFA